MPAYQTSNFAYQGAGQFAYQTAGEAPPLRKPMGFYGVSYRRKKKELVVELDEAADKQEVAAFIADYVERGRDDLPEMEIRRDVSGDLARLTRSSDKAQVIAALRTYADAMAELKAEEAAAEEREGLEVSAFLQEFLKDTMRHGTRKTNFDAILAAIIASEL